MDELFEKSQRKIAQVNTDFVRSMMNKIQWNSRLIGVKGARGVGKTTLLLQYIKLHLAEHKKETLYVSLDNIWFSNHRLIDLADDFVKRGGRFLFIDEVHHYESWSVELKNIYDDYPDLHVVFTGSSMLKILNARSDLSRRAIVYEMHGLSFREYLSIILNKHFDVYSFEDVLQNHIEIAAGIVKQIKPLQYFQDYLQQGYYPFFQEQPELYHQRIEEVINMILEIELPLTRNLEVSFVRKIKQLLLIISESAPFVPNITKLSERIGINRQTLLSYLFYLNESQLVFSLYRDIDGITMLQKPDKIFLENPNLMFTLAASKADMGTIRETFLANQLCYNNRVEYAPAGDFLINRKYTFEVGGKNKTNRQITKIPNAYIAADNIEYGYENKIPLWLFGFLY
ncbi:MAG: AAA family ATPase [Bacteroidales bacterium]|jgi:uncharacterized protein|nr:AAA family ATPase [Bacteroidales bacterium]MDD2205586.1 AAA family ATPase [Bacteroidales bacterium]MDD3915029.1 AAA family ATPase [Bacteroidales bacterium]MDD4634862.1 AAA family ATPase [Bacteroidales bacterium]